MVIRRFFLAASLIVAPLTYGQPMLGNSLIVTPERVSFGFVTLGEEREERVVVRNESGEALSGLRVIMANPTQSFFSFKGLGCPRALRPREICTIKVAFKPMEAGDFRSTFMLSYEGKAPMHVRLRGTGRNE